MTERNLDLISGCIQIDEIRASASANPTTIPGGAGLYAALGAGLACGQPMPVTGIGADYPGWLNPWLQRNAVSTRGLSVTVDETPINQIVYGDEDSRTETPLLGLKHFSSCEPTPSMLSEHWSTARSVYLFADSRPEFWAGIRDLRTNDPYPKLLWEVSLDACTPDSLGEFKSASSNVDAVSLNLGEAKALIGAKSEEEVFDTLGELFGKVTFLRAGHQGSFIIHENERRFVATREIIPVDVTGGGNAFGGAVLVGLAEGRELLECARMGTAAALATIAQVGPFDFISGSAASEAYIAALDAFSAQDERILT